MELSMAERLIVSNQLRILEKLYPDEAERLAESRVAVERGYEGYYWSVFQHIDRDVISKEMCTQVLDIMTMFSCLKDAYADLRDKSGINPAHVQFDGFDGNNEGEQLSFANFFCSTDGGRFKELVTEYVPNSHCPMFEMYLRMLKVFDSVPERMNRPRELSRESILKILAARPWPHG